MWSGDSVAENASLDVSENVECIQGPTITHSNSVFWEPCISSLTAGAAVAEGFFCFYDPFELSSVCVKCFWMDYRAKVVEVLCQVTGIWWVVFLIERVCSRSPKEGWGEWRYARINLFPPSCVRHSFSVEGVSFQKLLRIVVGGKLKIFAQETQRPNSTPRRLF